MNTPFIHQTDLFHPHGDPDDHWDLATVFAMAAQDRLSVDGILIDYPPDQRDGDPAVQAVAQLSFSFGLTGIPAVIGTRQPMRSRRDNQKDLEPVDGAGAEWIISTLKRSEEPVIVNIVGSCTDVAIAGLRDPDTFASKCKAVYLNAGSAYPAPNGRLEYNVELNPCSYAAIFDLPCPVYWCPCWHETESHEVGAYGTFYRFLQGDILPHLSTPLQNFFLFMLSRSDNPLWLRYAVGPVDSSLLEEFGAKRRNMWSTGSILHAAGLGVAIDGTIVPANDNPDPAFLFESITVSCDDTGATTWQPAKEPTNRYIFHVPDTAKYSDAMTDALKSVLS